MGGNESNPAAPQQDTETLEPWRNVNWDSCGNLKGSLRDFNVHHQNLEFIRILLHGPVGAGKSCFINSVFSVFKEQISNKAEEEFAAGKSCTILYSDYRISDKNFSLPLILTDTMGLEKNEGEGVPPDDLINALQGHVKPGYKVNPVSELSKNDPYYVKDPSLRDRVHCLVSVVSANSISQMNEAVIIKMKRVQKKAQDLKIPVVVLMTKVDEVSEMVKKDITNIYKCKKIKEKVRECSIRLGPAEKFVFSVCNYHDETEINNKKDVLILMALKAMASFANDMLEEP